MAKATDATILRRLVFTTAALVLVQSWSGMFVSLYADSPVSRTTRGGNFASNSLANVAWAIGHGTISLVIHAAMGLALVILVVSVIERAARHRRRMVAFWSALGGCFVVAAGLNGVSFLDFDGLDITSLLMSVFAFASVLCYLAAAYLLTYEEVSSSLEEDPARVGGPPSSEHPLARHRMATTPVDSRRPS